MNDTQSHDSAEPMSAGVCLWLAVSWIWVGIPLAWGVWQTVIKCLPLFS